MVFRVFAAGRSGRSGRLKVNAGGTKRRACSLLVVRKAGGTERRGWLCYVPIAVTRIMSCNFDRNSTFVFTAHPEDEQERCSPGSY